MNDNIRRTTTTDPAPTLPVPMTFRLPGPEWEIADPHAWGITNAVFLAVRRGLGEDYAPTIVLSGDTRDDASTLEQIADEALAKLRNEGAEDVELVKRRSTSTEHTATVVQTIGADVVVEGRRFDVRQAQVLRSFTDIDDPALRAVVVHTLSCTYKQFDAMAHEFKTFMASVHVEADSPAP